MLFAAECQSSEERLSSHLGGAASVADSEETIGAAMDDRGCGQCVDLLRDEERERTIALTVGARERQGCRALAESITIVTIGRSASDLFALWRDPDALRRILRPFADVQFVNPNHLRWSASLPIGTLDAEAVMVEDRPGDLVHWQTVPESNLRIDEYMRFRPAPQGPDTEATLTYDIDFSRVPAGPVMQALTSLFEQAPRALVRKLLHNFKSLAETGEIPTLEGGPSGREGYQGSTEDSTESPE